MGLDKVDFFAREIHHIRHAQSIYSKLPRKYKGHFYNNPRDVFNSVNKYVAVFSYGDLKQVDLSKKQIIFGEHGTGFYYEGVSHPSYAGGTAHRQNVVLRLSPNELHAKKENETLDTSKTTIDIIGIPVIDQFHHLRDSFKWDPERKPVVAISFHWDCKVVPETLSTYRHFIEGLGELNKKYELIGHSHPRLSSTIEPIYRKLGIRYEENWAHVIKEADVYICDNSSTIWEFAYLNKPVVLLNSPYYRRKVEHPGNPRFWKFAGVGPSVNEISELVPAIEKAWKNYKKFLPKLQEATNEIFTFTDGKNSQRAVDSIINLIGE